MNQMKDQNSPLARQGDAKVSETRGALELERDAQEFLLRALIDSVPDYLFVKDTESRFVVANPAVAQDLGRAVSELIGKTDFDLHPSQLAEKFFADEQQVIRSGKPMIDFEEFIVTRAGQKKWFATSKLPLRDANGKTAGIVGVCRNVTERKVAEDALAESESRWNFALESAGQGVWDHDLKNGTAYFSPVWRKMRGIGLEEPVDPSREAWLERVHPDDRERLIGETNLLNLGRRSQNSFEYRERHRNGHYIWILSRGKPIEFMPDGKVARIIGTDTDFSSLKLAEMKAAHEKDMTYRKHLAALEKAHEAAAAAHQLAASLARHDALTGLPNRRVFSENLDKSAAHARSGSLSRIVMIVDLDRFKPLNDIHGHAAGDEILQAISARLAAMSGNGDTIARLGGDEFGVILERSSETAVQAASSFAAEILSSLSQPICINEERFEVGASIGIAIGPSDGTDSETLLRAADMAMYRAKEEGKGGYRFFAPEMEKALRERIALEKDVRLAAQRHEFQPHYQPLMLLTGSRLVGFEVLARWTHAVRGNVSPDVFIPILEKLGLIGEMTYDLLRRACRDALTWPPELTIAVNISPLHLLDPLLPAELMAVLCETNFPPTRLEIEITESCLIADLEVAKAALTTIRGLGIKIAIDDFGTGYSSLCNLRELSFDKIKIDRSFISSMQSKPDSAKIVGSIIELAKSLGIPVIAEGIENPQEIQEIVRRGGEYGQGYYFGKAMPAADATVLALTAAEKEALTWEPSAHPLNAELR